MTSLTTLSATFGAAALALLSSMSPPSRGSGESLRVFLPSAHVNDDLTVTLPLHEGRVDGATVWFVVLDATGSSAAGRFGCNRADKLGNARGTGAVQLGHFDNGVLVMSGTVDFTPNRSVVPDPVTGFPPQQAQAGAVGDARYSPLVQLPDGTILNAPQLINSSGKHDKVVAFDLTARTVRFALSEGFSRGNAVLYISTDASVEVAAALEGVTLAPRLQFLPGLGDDSSHSSRASLAAFINGATGVDNPDRQGLNSALLGEGDPLNVLAWTPNQGRYSPMWDVFLARWEIAPSRQTGFADVEELAGAGDVVAPDGSAFGPSDFVVNCPIIAQIED